MLQNVWSIKKLQGRSRPQSTLSNRCCEAASSGLRSPPIREGIDGNRGLGRRVPCRGMQLTIVGRVTPHREGLTYAVPCIPRHAQQPHNTKKQV